MQSSHRWRLPLWGGAVAGIAFAAVLSWALQYGSKRFVFGFDLLQRPEALSGVLFLLLAGALVGGLIIAPRFHPLVSGIPAVWFVLVFGPSLVRWVPPDWYPQWIDAFFIPTHTPAAWVILGTLIVVTVASLMTGEDQSSDSDQPVYAARG